MKPADDFDCFERFCTLAGRRASPPEYGGSLPSIAGSAAGPARRPAPGYLDVPSPPCSHLRRSRSDSGDGARLARCGSDPRLDETRAVPRPAWPLKLWASIRSLAENCHGASDGCLPAGGCRSAPHSPLRRRRGLCRTQQELADEMRPRTASMPTRGALRRPARPLRPLARHPDPDDDDSGGGASGRRVRCFSTTAKGVVNRGDLFRRLADTGSQRSLSSGGSDDMPPDGWSAAVGGDSPAPGRPSVPQHTIRLLGAAGVGKATLARQFLTSVCLISSDETARREYTPPPLHPRHSPCPPPRRRYTPVTHLTFHRRHSTPPPLHPRHSPCPPPPCVCVCCACARVRVCVYLSRSSECVACPIVSLESRVDVTRFTTASKSKPSHYYIKMVSIFFVQINTRTVQMRVPCGIRIYRNTYLTILQ